MDRTAGRPSSGTLRRHRHRHRPTTARAGRSIDHGRPVAGRRPGHPRHRGRRLRRTPPGLPPARTARAGAGPDAFGPCPAQGRPAPPRLPGTMGRPPRHGDEFVFGQPDTWGAPDTETVTGTRLYGTALARCWDRLHPARTHRSSWAAADGTLPIARQPTDGPGWSSPPTPSCGLPGPWQPTGAGPGRKPARRTGSPPTRVRRDFRHIRPTTACPARRRKPPGPAPDDRRAARTPGPRLATTCTHPRKAQPTQRRTKKSTTPRRRRTG